jgi:hypothetical protein
VIIIMSNYEIHITNILLLKWMKPHSFISHIFFGANFSPLITPKKIQFDSCKGFCEKKALKSPHVKGFFFKKF